MTSKTVIESTVQVIDKNTMMRKAVDLANKISERLNNDDDDENEDIKVRDALINLLSVTRRCSETVHEQLQKNFEILRAAFVDRKGLANVNRFEQITKSLAQFCEFPASRQLVAVSGSCSFVFFPNIEGNTPLKVLIIGEQHHKRGLCEQKKHPRAVEIQDWLWDLAADTPECIDVFVEEYLHVITKNDKLGDIKLTTCGTNAIRERFQACVKRGNTHCPVALRYHAIDIRESFATENENAENLIALITKSGESERSKFYLKKWTNSKLHVVLNSILGFTEDPEFTIIKNFVLDLYHDLPSGSFPTPNMTILIANVNTIRKDIARQFQKSVLSVDRVMEIVQKFTFDWAGEMAGCIMDVFLLARLFAQFDSKKMQRGPIMCQSSTSRNVKNAIIYCGDQHQKFLTFFLRTYFSIEPKINKQCIASYHNKMISKMCTPLDEPFDFFAPAAANMALVSRGAILETLTTSLDYDAIMVKAVQKANDIDATLENSVQDENAKRALRNVLSLTRRCKESAQSQLQTNINILQNRFTDAKSHGPTEGSADVKRFIRTVQTLIQSCKLPLSRQLVALKGSCSFVYFSNIHPDLTMKVLLVGELHIKEGHCDKNTHSRAVDVQDWLWDLATDAPECLDLFVEDFFGGSDHVFSKLGDLDSKTSGFSAVRERFQDCGKTEQNNTSLCPKALRYHAVDIRRSSNENHAKSLFVLLGTSGTKNLTEFHQKWNNTKMHDVLHQMVGFDDENQDFNIIHDFATDLHKAILREIVGTLGFEINIITKNVLQIRKALKRQFRKTFLLPEQVMEVVDQFAFEHPVEMAACVMDIFLLARLFTQFDKKDMQKGPVFCHSTEFRNVKNAIIYCGNQHQKFLTFFLRTFFHTQPQINHQQCVSSCIRFDAPFDFFAR